jgi:hypothetical protein
MPSRRTFTNGTLIGLSLILFAILAILILSSCNPELGNSGLNYEEKEITEGDNVAFTRITVDGLECIWVVAGDLNAKTAGLHCPCGQ